MPYRKHLMPFFLMPRLPLGKKQYFFLVEWILALLPFMLLRSIQD